MAKLKIQNSIKVRGFNPKLEENIMGLNLRPVGANPSSFDTKLTAYIYSGKKTRMIHLHKGIVELGFTEGRYVDFLFDYPYLFISPGDNPEFGYKLSNSKKNDPRMVSTSLTTVSRDINLIEQPPAKKNADASGTIIVGKQYMFQNRPGVIFDLEGIILESDIQELFEEDEEITSDEITSDEVTDSAEIVNSHT